MSSRWVDGYGSGGENAAEDTKHKQKHLNKPCRNAPRELSKPSMSLTVETPSKKANYLITENLNHYTHYYTRFICSTCNAGSCFCCSSYCYRNLINTSWLIRTENSAVFAYFKCFLPTLCQMFCYDTLLSGMKYHFMHQYWCADFHLVNVFFFDWNLIHRPCPLVPSMTFQIFRFRCETCPSLFPLICSAYHIIFQSAFVAILVCDSIYIKKKCYKNWMAFMWVTQFVMQLGI